MELKSTLVDSEIDWETLQSRFPSIAFELSYGSYEKISCFYDAKGWVNAKGPRGFLYSEDIESELLAWKNSLALENIDVLYVYGVGLGYSYEQVKSWLHTKKERKLLFFEEEASVLEALFKQKLGSEILSDRQVHLYYVASEEMWPTLLEECTLQWMSDRIEWASLPSYFSGREKKVRALALSLLRKSATIHARVSESLHYSLLMQNIATNLLSIPDAFHANKLKGKFKNIPAVICGAGSSLGDAVEFIKDLDQKALVFAGGSAITALSYYGIRPHIAMAVDPNEEEYSRLRTSSCFETPFIYSSRLHKDILPSSNMQLGYLCSNTGGIFEAWVHDKLGIHGESFALELGDEALSVTTLAAAFAVELGCNPVIFCGVDLAYSNRQRYCKGVVNSSSISVKELEKATKSIDRIVRRKNMEGLFVHTLVKWVMEASCLGEYAKKHPDTQFLNLSSKGLPIPKAASTTKEELLKGYCRHNYDLRGMLRAESEALQFNEGSKDSLSEAFKELTQSFTASIPLFEKMLHEIDVKKKKASDLSISLDSGKMSVIEMDIAEEPAYTVCFQPIFSVYLGILNWWNPLSHSPKNEEERFIFLKKKERLWQVGLDAAKETLDYLKSC
jgi:hypothetical protein